jgi:hypothetical protein
MLAVACTTDELGTDLEVTPSSSTTLTLSTTIGDLTTPTYPSVDTNPGWAQLPTAPLEGRIWHSTTWTGHDLVIWGGLLPSTGTVHADGALFDAAGDEWRAMSKAPLAGRVGHVAVWTGNEVIVWGGHEGGLGGYATDRLQDGAAYDPDTDTWRLIASPNLSGGPGYASVWTGSEMIVIGGNDGFISFAENGVSEAGAYNPSTDTWRILDLPTDLLIVDAVWTGEEVIAYGIRAYLGPLIGVSYDPQANRWRDLPPAPIHSPVPDIDHLGDRVLSWTYDPEIDGIAALDLSTLQWHEVPAFPGRPSDGIPSAASIGPTRTMMASESFMAVLSEGSDDWQIVPTPTTRLGPMIPSAWTGNQALFFSSGLPPGDPNDPDGLPAWLWSYTPGN